MKDIMCTGPYVSPVPYWEVQIECHRNESSEIRKIIFQNASKLTSMADELLISILVCFRSIICVAPFSDLIIVSLSLIIFFLFWITLAWALWQCPFCCVRQNGAARFSILNCNVPKRDKYSGIGIGSHLTYFPSKPKQCNRPHPLVIACRVRGDTITCSLPLLAKVNFVHSRTRQAGYFGALHNILHSFPPGNHEFNTNIRCAVHYWKAEFIHIIFLHQISLWVYIIVYVSISISCMNKAILLNNIAVAIRFTIREFLRNLYTFNTHVLVDWSMLNQTATYFSPWHKISKHIRVCKIIKCTDIWKLWLQYRK